MSFTHSFPRLREIARLEAALCEVTEPFVCCFRISSCRYRNSYFTNNIEKRLYVPCSLHFLALVAHKLCGAIGELAKALLHDGF